MNENRISNDEKISYLINAIEIAKQAASGGQGNPLQLPEIIENTYRKILEIRTEIANKN